MVRYLLRLNLEGRRKNAEFYADPNTAEKAAKGTQKLREIYIDKQVELDNLHMFLTFFQRLSSWI